MTRPPARHFVFGLFALAVFAGLVALGTWQVQRRAWKLDLIAQVTSRLNAAPVPPPGPAAWPMIDQRHDGYRRLILDGQYLPGRQTLVQAVTSRGGGWWVMTPMRVREGFVVLVNRGFVATRTPPPAPAGRVRVAGLLRITEPVGGFLRKNDPAADRWYSRDVTAIARANGLGEAAPYFVAPYFVDANATLPGGPVGGLTVIAFSNNHLVYALTWYMLAIMVAAAYFYVLRRAARP